MEVKEESQPQQPAASTEAVPEAQPEPEVDLYEQIKTLTDEEKMFVQEKFLNLFHIFIPKD